MIIIDIDQFTFKKVIRHGCTILKMETRGTDHDVGYLALFKFLLINVHF